MADIPDMPVIEQGNGPPLVLIPGLQGRWEYVRPAVESLAAHFRVLTFSLGAGSRDGRGGIDAEVDRIVSVLDARRIERATLCGISYGGLVATRFAAIHPARTAALVVVSAPGPDWHLRQRHQVYARWPRLFGPLFLLETPFRLRRELAATFPNRADRWRFGRWQLGTILRAPVSPSQMAERARALPVSGLAADCRRISAPTLVVTGEPALDRVVAVESTLSYARLIQGARLFVLERTGHQGTITRPTAFAAAVDEFVRGIRPGAGAISRSEVA